MTSKELKSLSKEIRMIESLIADLSYQRSEADGEFSSVLPVTKQVNRSHALSRSIDRLEIVANELLVQMEASNEKEATND